MVHYISPVTVYVITRCVIDAGRRWVKAHVMNIYPRLLQNKCQYRRKSNRKKQRRNHIIPGYVYVFPERFPRVCYAYIRISTGRLKFHPILSRRDRWCWTAHISPWKLEYLFPNLENAAAFARLLGRESCRFRFSMKNLVAMINPRIKFGLPEARWTRQCWERASIEGRFQIDIHREIHSALVSPEQFSQKRKVKLAESFISIWWKFFGRWLIRSVFLNII